MDMGKERLTTLTQQLGNMFGQSGPTLTTTTRNTAAQEPIKNYIRSQGKGSDTAVLRILKKLRPDSTWVSTELLNADRQLILESGKFSPGKDFNLDAVVTSMSLKDDECKIGNFYAVRDSIYYPVIAPVTDKNQVIGYLVRWRLQLATQKALTQFSQLLGADAVLYVGNIDGSLWTNLIKPVPGPKADTAHLKNSFEYSPPQGDRVIALAQPIPNTPWLLMIGFPKKTIMATSNRFLNSAILIGGVLICIGILIAWFMSRTITRPLKQLTATASAMAEGDYSLPVQVNRRDEVGKLARAFSIMKDHIQVAQVNLENKVQERTAQLKASNKDLEAFSYSVSHDLRAPLRAIGGYAMILKEDYGKTLDDEANRITDRIVVNAKMMGQLIDDLISFSQMGVKEVIHETVDMKKIAETCMAELLHHETPNKYQVHINPLPPCHGDVNLIKQVWMNMISNAIKYSSKKPVPCIEIGCTEGINMHTYFIRDNGIGFDMKYAHKLFGVFQRLHSQNDFAGTGIGLAFVKRIINKHEGVITGESAPGEGAVFYFTLPVAKSNTASSEPLSQVLQGHLFKLNDHD
jgi:signal transduction histidine kinase